MLILMKASLSACPRGDAPWHWPGRLSSLLLVFISFLAGSTIAQSQLVGDLDGNYRVDSKDLRAFAWQWLNPICLVSDCIADLDDVDGVNMGDYALLAKNWQIEEPHIVISEFMASNTSEEPLEEGDLLDGNGDSSDWIEIYNPTDTAVNLDGWCLTDSKTNLTMWQFPDGNQLEPGEFLVVFASGKTSELYPDNYPYLDSLGYYHTNFELNKEGDYLALVANDGNTIVHEYTPEFPTQLADISYGLAQYAMTLVPTGATASYYVPTSSDAALGTGWTAADFNDSSWETGKTGLGFGFGGAPRVAYNDVIYSSDQDIASNVTKYCIGNGNPGPTFGPLLDQATGDNTGITVTLTESGGVSWQPSSETGGSDCAVGTDAHNTFGGIADMTGVLLYGGTGWQVNLTFTGLDPATEYTFATSASRSNPDYTNRWANYTLTGADTYTNASTSGVVVLAENKVQFNTGDNHNEGYVARWTGITAADGSFTVQAEADPSSESGYKAYSFDVFKLEGGFSGTDIEEDMLGVNSSLWTRTEFFLEEGDFGAFDTLKLRMKYEDGFVAYLNDVEVASCNAPSPVQWDSAADSDRPIEESRVFKSINIMSNLGLLQPLPEKNVLSIHGLNNNKNDGEFLILPELVAARNRLVPQYFTTATPGTFNISGAMGVVDEVWFSHKSGYYNTPFQLILSTGDDDVEIRYTLDGSLPTITHGITYTGPFGVSETTTIRTVAVKPGWLDSPVETQAYIFLEPDVLDFSSNLPIAIVDTFGGGIGQTTHTLNYTGFIDTTTGGRARITDPTNFIGRSGINIRGKSSTSFPKKQYHLESWDEYDQDKDVSILGFPSESDWILQGPYSDKSLMRNFLSYKWSNDVGRYAVRTRFIELFLNTGGGGVSLSDYVGVYVLMERIKRNENRVDIARLDSTDNTEPDITGGYIIKKDKIDSGEPTFNTSTGQQLLYYEPKWTEITQAQKDWIKGYLDEYESVLYGPNFTDPIDGYAKYIDVDSFVDHHIIVELTKNIDGFRLSTYMFKDRGGKLNMGPVWDYNLSLGNADYYQGWLSDGWYYSQLNNTEYPWWRRLFEDPEFRLRYADRWFGLRRKLFTTDQLLQTVNNTAALLNEAQARNFVKWPILGIDIWPNWFIAHTYQEEINWMKGWLGNRLTWMDAQIGTEFAAAPPLFNQQGGQVNQVFNLTMTASSGTIYYTLDGNDPRQPFTGNPVGTQYSGQIALNKSTQVKARVRDGITWSALNEAIFAVGPLVESLRITEIMYHPQDTGDANDPNKEFIELKNIGLDTLNLNLARFT
ncbi:MAG: CotH kinase family protein, partial [Sedimentisphaerales bacterium]